MARCGRSATFMAKVNPVYQQEFVIVTSSSYNLGFWKEWISRLIWDIYAYI